MHLVCLICSNVYYRQLFFINLFASNRTPMNILLLNLAVADIMVALFVAPRFILSHVFNHPDGKTGTVVCKLLTGGNLTWTGGACSVFTLVAIAFERYYAVMYPYGNKGKLTYNKLKVLNSFLGSNYSRVLKSTNKTYSLILNLLRKITSFLSDMGGI